MLMNHLLHTSQKALLLPLIFSLYWQTLQSFSSLWRELTPCQKHALKPSSCSRLFWSEFLEPPSKPTMLISSLFLLPFSTTEYALRIIAGMTNADVNFTQFVSCPKCFKSYNKLQTWVIYSHSKPAAFLCEHVEFPRHPHASWRSKCGATLLKQINTGSSTFLRPLKVYPYRSVIRSLNDLLVRPDMLKLCNEWVLRTSKDPLAMTDVYDGQMWKDCLDVNGRPFLSQPNNLALSLNVDWFRPFQHSPYSIGVIYMAVLNLPREIRYLPENVIITGIVPGLNEPSKSMMNAVLEPVVGDMQTLFDGVYMPIPTLMLLITHRALLLCISCDIPACRKVCGFLGHNAHLACSKCT